MTETAKWYEKAGNCGDVVISTRVRLARNLKQYPFPARATDKQREAVEQKVKDALLSGNSILSKEFRFLPLESASEEEAVSLVERHIVSPEFISDRRGKAVLISEDESISIMINEEDHLRIQVLREGLSLKEAAETADRIDTLLSETLDFAYDQRIRLPDPVPHQPGHGPAGLGDAPPARLDGKRRHAPGVLQPFQAGAYPAGHLRRGEQNHRRPVPAFQPDYLGPQRERGRGKPAGHHRPADGGGAQSPQPDE